MSVTARPIAPPAAGRPWRRLALAAGAVAIVAACMMLVIGWFAPPVAAPVRNPFGMGLREAAPSGGIGAAILATQAGFYRGLQGAVAAMRQDGGSMGSAAFWSLMGLGFAYGVFHAAGPGHGKAVISGYIVADEQALRRGFGLSLAAALVQALVAIGIVSIAALLFHVTAATMNALAARIEIASFALVTALGILITWRKAGKLSGIAALARDPLAVPVDAFCDHAHMPTPDAFEGRRGRREILGIVLAAGIRPCAGALILLVFALSQGLFAAGIAATFAMALGTALTTGAIAALAVFAKAAALRLASGRGAAGALATAGIELLAAAFVLVLGAGLLLGLLAGAGA
jgi:nickel/cobalt exporter